MRIKLFIINSFILALSLFLSLFINSCSNNKSYVEANIVFSTAQSPSSKKVSIPSTQEADYLLDDYYSSLGNLVLSATPINFIVPTTDISLQSSEGLDQVFLLGVNAINNPTVEDFLADFTGPLRSTPNVTVEQGLYDSLIISFQSENRKMSGEGTCENPDWTFDLFHDITVKIPGYTDNELPNIPGSEMGYDRYYLGDNTFRFTFGKLQPICWPSNIAIEYIVYTSTANQNDLIVPGFDGVPDRIRVADYCTDPSAGSDSTNGPIMVVPFEGIDLNGMESITFIITLDIDKIIEVYDNNTPDDKTDDIVVFKNDFWNQFSIAVEGK